MKAFDVIVVGGGVIGSALSWRLAQRGLKTLVLDRSRPGQESSWAAGGILAPQIESKQPGPLMDFGLESRARYPAFVSELREATGLDVGYVQCGAFELAFDEAGAKHLDEVFAWQSKLGYAIERLDGDAARKLEPALSPSLAGALRFPTEGQLEPRRLCEALFVAAARAGATYTQAEVRRIAVERGRVTGVEIDSELISAGKVVLAAGAWSSLIPGVPLVPAAVRPVRGQMVEIATLPPRLSHVCFGPGGYLVPRRDGRILVGSTMELVGYEKRVTVSAMKTLLGNAERFAPSLADASVVDSWSGLRPQAADQVPLIGPMQVENLFAATGHFRNGILLAPLTADLVADVVSGQPAPRVLAPFLPARLAA